MDKLIFRVMTGYGIHDHNSLREAKKHSKPEHHIQLIAPDGLTILSSVRRAGATIGWAIRTAEKYGFTTNDMQL